MRGIPALLCLFLLPFFLGCLTPTANTRTKLGGLGNTLPANPKLKPSQQLNAAFALNVGDVIAIEVHGEPDLKGTYQIYPDCNITFPMIKAVRVCGRTPSSIRQEISTRLHKDFFQAPPSVTVLVKEFNSKKVSVLGAVSKPGRFDYTPGLTVLQVLAMAGGFTAKADRSSTRLIRNGKLYRVPLGSLGKRKLKTYSLRPGDVIHVAEGWL